MTHIDKKGYTPITIRIYSKEKQLLLEDEELFECVSSRGGFVISPNE